MVFKNLPDFSLIDDDGQDYLTLLDSKLRKTKGLNLASKAGEQYPLSVCAFNNKIYLGLSNGRLLIIDLKSPDFSKVQVFDLPQAILCF
jgi:hypothetical protein